MKKNRSVPLPEFSARRCAVVFAFLATLTFLSSCAETEGAKTTPPAVPEAPSGSPPFTENELKILKLIGGEATPELNVRIGEILIDRHKNELSFPAKLNMTSGPIECLVCTKAGRMHESLLVSDVEPKKLQLALTLFGVENGARKADSLFPQGSLLDIFVRTEDGRELPIETWILGKFGEKVKASGWVFVGSSFASDGSCIADEEGNLVVTWSFGNTILDNPSELGDSDDSYSIDDKAVPAYKSPVCVILRKR